MLIFLLKKPIMNFEWTCFEMKKEKEKRKCYFQIDKSQIHTQLVLTKVFMFC